MSSVDRINGLTGDLAIKTPVRVATTANISLAALQTIDGVSLAAGDRVLVKDQTDAVDNGIWLAATSSWSRDLDFDGSYDCVQGTLIPVTSGTTNGQTVWQLTTASPVIGTSSMTFERGAFSDAANVAADDGASGSLWKTVQGFIDKLLSSAGSSIVGFIQAGTGAVTRTLDDKIKETAISVTDYMLEADRTANYLAPGSVDVGYAIQAALTAVDHGGAVWFPKLGGGSGDTPSYLISTGLTLSKNDVTLFSESRAEYSEGIKTSAAIDILTCTGYGLKVKSLSFQGNGSQTTFATTNGIVINRTPNGDAETYSNLDAQIIDCSFFLLKDGLRGVGRNVFVFDNIFSLCKRGVVGELHTYGGGTVSDFRGWRVSRNRFHSCGAPYIDAGSSEVLPANLAALDSWCIQLPQTSGKTSHLEIFDNNADFCGAGFYKGYLAGAKINGNLTHGGSAIFVYAVITDGANQSACSNFVNTIENNSINSRTADATGDRGYQFSLNSIVVLGVSNLVLARNVMHNAAESHILVTACTRASVNGNACSNGNMLFVSDSTTRPCVVIDQSTNVTCTDNKVWSTIGTVYSNGIQITSATSGLKLRDNTVLNATTPISAEASALVNSADDGLAWQTPSMTNSFTLVGTTSKGFRRMFNGKVQIQATVQNGTDNTAAFTLPVGYRPSVAVFVPGVGVFNHAYAQVETNGQVVVNWEATPATSYSIVCEFEAA